MALSQNDLKDIEAILKRKPSEVETHIFDTMWSEHCSYKSSKAVLRQLPTKASTVALGIGEDAGIIRFHKHNGKQYCIAVSHESHNHPSQLLPIEGAATGVGGCVRDVYCMGADVLGVLNSLHFGIKTDDNHSLVDEIEEKVVLGVAGYGNPLGVPVLGGETLYHKSYNDNCLVNVAALGLIEEDRIIHSYVPEQAKHEPYDIILIGKPTDATGFGGASFSSATLDEDSASANMGAVQVHDPFLKRVLVEAIKRSLEYVKEQGIAIGFKDLGAGGISCATSEIAVGGGFGVEIDLNKVNVAFDNLKPEVIACSETQERFCMAVPRSHAKQVCDIFNIEFQIPVLYPKGGAAIIGEVKQENHYKITYNGDLICELPVECITTEVKADRYAKPREIITQEVGSVSLINEGDLETLCKTFFDNKMNCSKRYVYRFFDNAVKGHTVVYPGESDSVVVKPIKESDVGLAVTMDSNLYGKESPYMCGAGAVAESIRNLISVGASPLTITDCLNYGNPENPDVFFDFQEGVRGISEAARALSFSEEPIPIISGNVSFYNESKQGNAVIPSPVICALGKVDDIKTVKTAQFFEEGLDIFLIGKRYREFAGTQIEDYVEIDNHACPQVRFEEEKRQNKLVLDLYNQSLIESCHDISAGGVWEAIVEMVLGERGKVCVGVKLDLKACRDLVTLLFSENGGFVCATSNKEETLKKLEKSGVFYAHLGETIEEKTIIIEHDNIMSFSTEELSTSWNQFNP
ncbi:phosphoribosylformylglycinamidine synthase subunit PurL [Candidatus Marinamargulisbacteria bacterium SCGC AG-343-D04]|nr:phosphoribosylformylglycinamidine synthase subunit PurL [Candidatus Marinamargulisbacteria bacterium SCGC AG-343-D04]